MERDGIHALRLTPDAGTIKSGATRMVPAHEHLVAQGFIKFVKSRGDGPLFYNPENAPKAVIDPTNPPTASRGEDEGEARCMGPKHRHR
jgi:hypothetical protein